MTPHPYPGLRPFKREESDIFFGREQHVDQLLEKLAQQHFLAVVGTSGCGKSSLVKAGMLPALDAGFLAQAGARWTVADLRPGHRPMWALAESLLASQAFAPARGTEPESLALLHATLRRGPLGLVEAMRETPLPETANLLVLVDQFEEIFRYRRDIDSQEADAFVALLVASARQREVNVYIALTMRSDFLGDCAVFLDLPETINESQFLAPRLTRDQRAAAITEPARVFGGDVDPGLVNQMLNDMGADPDQLPLMQHALMRMWDLAFGGHSDNPSVPAVGKDGIGRVVLGLEHYRSVGGFSEALSSHADEALAELKDVREQRIAERIFKRLTTREEGERDTRDPTTLRELVAITEAPADEVIRVINVFSQAGRSFLTPHLESSPSAVLDTMIDISHESLIRQWGTLKKWVIEEAQSADVYRRLEETARLYRAKNADPYRGLDLQAALHWRKTEQPTDAWAKRYGAKRKESEAFEGAIAFLEESDKNWDKEQASQERRRRIIFFSVCAVMIGALAAASYVGWLWQTAEAEQNKAVALKLVAEGQLAENRDRNQLQLHALLAIESTKRYPSALANQSLRHALELMPRPLATMVHQDSVSAVGFSPDGKLLASGSRDNTVRVWDLATGKELQRFSHDSPVNAVSFSPGGKLLASGSEDKTVRLWDLATGKELQRFSHDSSVTAVSFSPDGKTLASGSGDVIDKDNTVRVWDLATGKELHRLAHDSTVNAVSFSPDGKTLATGSWDKTVRLWLWQPDDLMAAVCERSTRNLNWDEWSFYLEDMAYAKTCAHLPVHESVIDHAQQLAESGNVAEATALFQRISEIEPSMNLDPSAETGRWGRQGKLEKKKYAEWIGLASEAVQLDPTAVLNKDWNEVCWDGVLDGQAAVVMRACDRAVEHAANDDPIQDFRDSRGLARALTGNVQGAIEDFEFFIRHTDNAEQKSQRQAWVGALKAGQNPFTPEVLQSLRQQ